MSKSLDTVTTYTSFQPLKQAKVSILREGGGRYGKERQMDKNSGSARCSLTIANVSVYFAISCWITSPLPDP